jgi:hypothetical protein
MDVNVTKDFLKSLKKLRRHDTFFYKIHDTLICGIPNFLKNIWFLRRGLYHHRWWDTNGLLMIISDTLKEKSEKVEKFGLEIDETRLKKVEKMRRCVEILENIINDDYLEISEKELGELFYKKIQFVKISENPDLFKMESGLDDTQEIHNKKVYKRSEEINQKEWEELLSILKGTDYKDVSDKPYEEWYDGSDYRSWWD